MVQACGGYVRGPLSSCGLMIYEKHENAILRRWKHEVRIDVEIAVGRRSR